MLDVVMEVSKLTEKRFTIADYPTDIQDNQTGKKYPCSSYGTHMEIICDLLNGLNDELGKYRILYASKEKTAEVLLRDGIALEHEIKSLKTENQKLKQTILYLIGCLECEQNIDMDDECQQLLDCGYKEANEKYGGCSYDEINEKYVWK